MIAKESSDKIDQPFEEQEGRRAVFGISSPVC